MTIWITQHEVFVYLVHCLVCIGMLKLLFKDAYLLSVEVTKKKKNYEKNVVLSSHTLFG